jgi:hypothetical protein
MGLSDILLIGIIFVGLFVGFFFCNFESYCIFAITPPVMQTMVPQATQSQNTGPMGLLNILLSSTPLGNLLIYLKVSWDF